MYTYLPKSFRDKLYTKVVAKLFLTKQIEARFAPPPLKGSTRSALAENFAASNRILSEMAEVDLSFWLDPGAVKENRYNGKINHAQE